MTEINRFNARTIIGESWWNVSCENQFCETIIDVDETLNDPN